jgi:protein O-mannosyl-transferase
VQVGKQAMADRYTYLPSIGIAIMLAWGIPLLFPREDIRKKILFPTAIAILTILSVLTWEQCGYWKNSIKLWNHTLQVTKDNYLAHTNLGIVLSGEGKINEAIDHYNEAIRITPDSAEFYYTRGTAYGKLLGQYRQAIEDFNKAIALKPDYTKAYNNRGLSYYSLGQYMLAIEDFNKAIRIQPDYADAYKNRGIAHFIQGNKELGCLDSQKACELGNCQALAAARSNGYCR